MADSPPINKLLGRLKWGDDEAARQITEHFWQAAYKAIRGNLNPAIRRVVDNSGLANAALRSALSHFAGQDSTVDDGDEFRRWLVMVCRRKAKSAQREALAKKRDLRRTQALESAGGESIEAYQAISNEPSAEELLVAKELGERIMSLLGEETDEIKREAVVLKIFQDFSSAEISAALQKAFPNEKPRALRTIQNWVSVEQERLQAALREEYGDE